MDLPVIPSVHIVLAFLEYLYMNSISYKVITSYVSLLKKAAHKYHINTRFTPTVRGIFDITTLSLISQTCESLEDAALFRAVFLLAFFGFLRMSNIAPHSRYKFDRNKHFLRQDIIFAPPGAHILLKWTKTLQESTAHHFVQLPALSNPILCPVLAIKKLMAFLSIFPLLSPFLYILTLLTTRLLIPQSEMHFKKSWIT